MPEQTREWRRAAAADEIADGAIKTCEVDGRLIVLVRIGGRYGALDSRCPHMGGPLGEGALEFGRLVCPWHGREYDPFTGACEAFAEQAESFPVEVRGDGVYVALPRGR